MPDVPARSTTCGIQVIVATVPCGRYHPVLDGIPRMAVMHSKHRYAHLMLNVVMQLPRWCMPTPITKHALSKAPSFFMTPSVGQNCHFDAYWWCVQHSLASGMMLGKDISRSAHNSSQQQGKLLPWLWLFCLRMTHVAACDASEVHSK